MVKAILILALAAFASSVPTNPSLAKTLTINGTANIIIKMEAGTGNVLKSLNASNIVDRATRLTTVTSALKAHSAESQKNVITALAGVEHHVLWITNEIYVPAANATLVEKLAAIEGIAEIHEEYMMYLDQPIEIKDTKAKRGLYAEPNIELIQAHLVWSELGIIGEGAVVSSIDTGVRATHEALRDNINVDYFWLDPAFNTQFPDDRNGHGTHIMGTLAGSHGIGVAPGAKWMACRGCATNSCSQSDLTRCAQFIACPTRPDGTAQDCSKAPHVVVNSWGGGQGNPWYDEFINAWHAAGVIPVFSAGNSGPSCGTIGSPADSHGVIAVGAATNTVSSFSSRGDANTLKPDIVAPGTSIRSAYNAGDTSYASLSGTSMAASHVAGTIGLMFAKNPNLTYNEVTSILFSNTDTNLQPTGRDCGIPESTIPNNSIGWGRVNAFKSVLATP